MDHKNDLGVPRWQDANAYPDAGDLDVNQWRWEFLRRRPDYRRAWIDHFDACQARYDEMDAAGLLGGRREQYRGVGSTMRDICDPFGVDRIAAPWLKNPGRHFWRRSFGWTLGVPSANTSHESLIEHQQALEDKGILLFAFDINRPFKEQAEAVQLHFESLQRERIGSTLKPRKRVDLWSDYLRAIDAKQQDATFENLWVEIIGAKLSPEEYDQRMDGNPSKSGRQFYEQARDTMYKVTS